jgi:hypothetical protein
MSDDYEYEYAEQDTAVVDSEGNMGEQDIFADSEGNVIADTWVADGEGNYVEEIDYLKQ